MRRGVATLGLMTGLGMLVLSGAPPAQAKSSPHRAVGSPWSSPQRLGTSNVPAGLAFGVVGLEMGMAADGSSVTIWTHHGIHVRWRSANGDLGPDQLVAADAVGNGTLAVAPNGTAVIVWAVKQGKQYETRACIRSADGTLRPVRDLGRQLLELLHVTYGPQDGLARFMWAQDPSPPSVGQPGRFVAALGDTGLLSPAQFDDPTQDTDSTALVNTFSALAVNSQGDALIVWLDQASSKLFGRVLSRSGSLGPELTIATSAGASPSPRVSMSPDGVGYVMWANGWGVVARQVNVSGAMGPTLHITRTAAGSNDHTFDVASFSDGRAVVAWGEDNFKSIRGRIVSRIHAGAPFRISSSPSLNLWLVAHGRQAVAVWTDMKTAGEPGGRSLYGLQSRTISANEALGKTATLFPNAGRGFLLSPWSVAVAGNTKDQVAASWLVRNYQPGLHETVRGISVLAAGRR